MPILRRLLRYKWRVWKRHLSEGAFPLIPYPRLLAIGWGDWCFLIISMALSLTLPRISVEEVHFWLHRPHMRQLEFMIKVDGRGNSLIEHDQIIGIKKRIHSYIFSRYWISHIVTLTCCFQCCCCPECFSLTPLYKI